MRTEVLAGLSVLVIDGDGPAVGVRDIGELLQGSLDAEAATVAIGVDRCDPAFFELRSGVAGEIVQRLANYRLRLAVVGALPEAAAASRSFSGFVLEGNRGDGPWFVATLDDLAGRLAAASPRRG